jgi:RIO-like serine/threonine protein kinase
MNFPLFERLSLSDPRQKRRGMLRAASSTRPAIRRVEEKGMRAVVKDFSANRYLFRNTVGRFLIWREAKAYRRLKGVKGVPTLYRVIDGIALIIEEIPGRSLENLEQEMRLPPAFFDELNNLVACFHRRGLAHCDLKRAPNTLLGEDGHPYIVDWAASISEAEFRLPLLRLIYRRFLLDDLLAVIKLKLRHSPETVTPEERARYVYRSMGEKFIRGVRDRLREMLQKAA